MKISCHLFLQNSVDQLKFLYSRESWFNKFWRHSLKCSRHNYFLNLENSITFAKLYTVHPYILITQNLEVKIYDLKLHPTENEIFNLSIHSWYSIIKTNCYLHRNKIIFTIEIQINNSNSFQYFDLFPLPSENNEIISPLQKFLALEQIKLNSVSKMTAQPQSFKTSPPYVSSFPNYVHPVFMRTAESAVSVYKFI